MLFSDPKFIAKSEAQNIKINKIGNVLMDKIERGQGLKEDFSKFCILTVFRMLKSLLFDQYLAAQDNNEKQIIATVYTALVDLDPENLDAGSMKKIASCFENEGPRRRPKLIFGKVQEWAEEINKQADVLSPVGMNKALSSANQESSSPVTPSSSTVIYSPPGKKAKPASPPSQSAGSAASPSLSGKSALFKSSESTVIKNPTTPQNANNMKSPISKK